MTKIFVHLLEKSMGKIKENKNLKKTVQKVTKSLKFIFYALTIILPSVAAQLSGYTSDITTYIVENPWLPALGVIAMTLIAMWLPTLANVVSVACMMLATLMVRNLVSLADADVLGGMSRADAFAKLAPVFGIVFFGVLFLYIATSNSFSFGMIVLLTKNKIQSRIDRSSKRKFREIVKDRPGFFDLSTASCILALILAAGSVVAAYYVFISSGEGALLATRGTSLICDAPFILIDIIGIFLGFTYSDVESAFKRE